MIDSAETLPGGRGSGQGQDQGKQYERETWYKEQ